MRLRPLLKPVLNRILPPLTKWYLRHPRKYAYDGLKLTIHPGVFHPGLFISTQYLLKFIRKRNLKGKKVLELGAGSGLISLWLARSGAEVTAIDISQAALKNIEINATQNDISLKIVSSDLFQNLNELSFSIILINPPYFQGQPGSEEEHAWYCGPEFEYFQRLFREMRGHLEPEGEVIMVLSEDVEVKRIQKIAQESGWEMREIDRKKKWMEWNYLFSIALRQN